MSLAQHASRLERNRVAFRVARRGCAVRELSAGTCCVRRNCSSDAAQRRPGVGHETERQRVVAPEKAAIPVDLEGRLRAGERKGPPVGREVAETRAHNEDDIGSRLDVGRRGSVATEADDSKMERMAIGKDALTVGCADDRALQHLGQFEQLPRGTPRSVADDEKRPP
jgi:hypothetical protein